MRQTKAFLCAALGLMTVSGLAAPQYKVVHLNNLVQTGIIGAGISQSNEVVFGSQDGENFSWRNGIKTDLSTLGNPRGYYNRISPSGTYYFLNQYFDGSSSVPFPKIDIGGQFNFGNYVQSMNSSGLAVGYATYTDYDYVGYVYKNGVATLTNAPGSGKSIFFDVNDHGRAMVWGNNSGSFGPDQLYIWENGNYRNVTQYIFQPGPWLQSADFRINNDDVFVGGAHVYTPDGMGGYSRTKLAAAANGKIPGPFRLNNRGDFLATGIGVEHPTLIDGYVATRTASYRIKDIVGSQLPSAAFEVVGWDINDNGWIVGTYRLGDPLNANTWTQHAFVMQPVPEPLTLLALGLGVAALGRRRKS